MLNVHAGDIQEPLTVILNNRIILNQGVNFTPFSVKPVCVLWCFMYQSNTLMSLNEQTIPRFKWSVCILRTISHCLVIKANSWVNSCLHGQSDENTKI